MEKNKILLVLKSFSPLELNKLRKFITSPYFNSNEGISMLFEILLNSLKRDQISANHKEIFWKKVHPSKPFDDVRYRKYQSDLLRLVKSFLVHESFHQDSFKKSLLLLKEVRERNLNVLNAEAKRKADKALKNIPNQSSEHFQGKILLEKELYLLDFKERRIRMSNLEELVKNIDNYYYTERLKISSDIQSRSRFVNRKIDSSVAEQLIQNLDKKTIEAEPITQMYKVAYQTQMASIENDIYFLELKKLLAELNNEISNNDLISLYTSLINYCIKQINSGNQEYLEKLLEIYKAQIADGTILDRNVISKGKFKNISILALRVGQFDWAESFIREYIQFLPLQIQENQKRFQLSALYFYQKEYGKVVEILRDFEFKDIIENLNSKTTLLQTYYEIKEFDALDSLLRSLKTFITRHKEIDRERLILYKNLIKIMSQMIQTIPGDKKRVEKLRKTLSEMKGIAASRQWIEEKIDELERGR